MKRILFLLWLALAGQKITAQSVGIGTTTPNASSQLDVTSTTKGMLIPRMTGAQRSAIPSPEPGLMVIQTNNEVVPPSSPGFYIFEQSGITPGAWKRIARADEISSGTSTWTVNGSSQYSNVSGNVGIGIGLPTSKLHLVGNLLQESGTLTINNTTPTIQFQSGGLNKGFLQATGDNIRIATSSGNTLGKFVVRLNNIEPLTIDPSGNVGIGTSSPDPSALADMSSVTKGLLIPRMTGTERTAIVSPANGLMVYETTTNSFWYYNSSVWNQLGTGGASPWTVSGNTIYNSNTGNIGIGISTPTSKLHVVGNSLVENGNITIDNDFGTLYFKSANSNKGYVQLRSTNDFKMGTTGIANTTGKLIFETQSIGRITIEPDGNVGIGYSNPVYKMDVNGSLRANGNFAVDDGAVFLNNTIDNKTWVLQNNTSSNGLYFLESGLGRLMLKNGGNVGINTSSPLTKLQIEGGQDAGLTSTNNGYIMNGPGTGANLIIDNNEIMARSGFTTASTLYLQNNGGELSIGARTTINKDGEALKLNGLNPYISFTENGVNKANISKVGSDLVLGVTGGALLLSPVGGSVLINPSSGNNVLISPTGGGDVILNPTGGGQVAIGNVVAAASAYKLTVGGKIICEELKVKLQSAGWPDYVFDKKYKLPPLNEVEKFIEQHQHLPNIPSAAEVEKNGIEVGIMQKRMMEKIE